MTPRELQILKNITREYMRLRAAEKGCAIEQTRDIVCVQASLEVLSEHGVESINFYQPSPGCIVKTKE